MNNLKRLYLAWYPNAFSQYLWFVKHDRAYFRKVNQLIKSIYRDGALSGLGKPEHLKRHSRTTYSRRINKKDRLVYIFNKHEFMIISCRYHYHKK